jgi:glycosyltransferase involved in cell wall biosynthesis
MIQDEDHRRDAPSLSVVVPFFDAPEQLGRCLAALRASSASFELILADDCSTDVRAMALAADSGARCTRLPRNSGPAAARNAGARLANGEILVFIDSDVLVERDTLQRLADVFATEPAVAACFGSYDDEPAQKSVVSTYRNLLHHYVHQTGPREATTFWAGCGGVRRQIFDALGGFDPSYTRPSIEDIELGMRIKASGASIRLEPSIQVKHLKRWRLGEMVRVDVTRRAIPWTQLLIDRPGTGGDLNLAAAQKLCVVLVFLALASIPAAAVATWLFDRPSAWWAPLALLAPVVWINRGLYRLFLRKRGFSFALAGFALHLLYYVYGGVAYAYAHATHRSVQRKTAATAG